MTETDRIKAIAKWELATQIMESERQRQEYEHAKAEMIRNLQALDAAKAAAQPAAPAAPPPQFKR
jgi:hypothetical protein